MEERITFLFIYLTERTQMAHLQERDRPAIDVTEAMVEAACASLNEYGVFDLTQRPTEGIQRSIVEKALRAALAVSSYKGSSG